MRPFHLILSAGLLAGMAAYAQAATPDWSAFIATGQGACLESGSCSKSEGLDASSDAAQQATFNWNAFITTGQGACLESGSCSTPEGLDASSDAAQQATFNWNAFIATGQGACLESGSCSNSYRRLDASNAPAP